MKAMICPLEHCDDLLVRNPLAKGAKNLKTFASNFFTGYLLRGYFLPYM